MALKQRFSTALIKLGWAKLTPFNIPHPKINPKQVYSVYPSVEKFKRLEGRDHNEKPDQQLPEAIVRLVESS